MSKKTQGIAYLTFFILSLISCATEPKSQIGKDYNFEQTSSKSIVFGKIDVKTKGVMSYQSYNAFFLKRAFTGRPVL
jgi:hypothetical protein